MERVVYNSLVSFVELTVWVSTRPFYGRGNSNKHGSSKRGYMSCSAQNWVWIKNSLVKPDVPDYLLRSIGGGSLLWRDFFGTKRMMDGENTFWQQVFHKTSYLDLCCAWSSGARGSNIDWFCRQPVVIVVSKHPDEMDLYGSGSTHQTKEWLWMVKLAKKRRRRPLILNPGKTILPKSGSVITRSLH